MAISALMPATPANLKRNLTLGSLNHNPILEFHFGEPALDEKSEQQEYYVSIWPKDKKDGGGESLQLRWSDDESGNWRVVKYDITPGTNKLIVRHVDVHNADFEHYVRQQTGREWYDEEERCDGIHFDAQGHNPEIVWKERGDPGKAKVTARNKVEDVTQLPNFNTLAHLNAKLLEAGHPPLADKNNQLSRAYLGIIEKELGTAIDMGGRG